MASTQDPNNAITARNREQSPLLRLPAEIRNKIYHYVIVVECIRIWPSQKAIKRSKHDRVCSMYSVIPTIQLAALSSTCRELHAETALLPFSLNTFAFHSNGLPCNKHWRKFPDTPSAEQRAAILRVSVYEPPLEDAGFVQFLADCHGLEELEVTKSHRAPDWSAEKKATLEKRARGLVGDQVRVKVT